MKIKVNGYNDGDDVIAGVKKPVAFIAEAKYKNCRPKYKWDFGDGQTSGQKTPSHPYANPKQYSVKLAVECEATCRDASGSPPPVVARDEKNGQGGV